MLFILTILAYWIKNSSISYVNSSFLCVKITNVNIKETFCMISKQYQVFLMDYLGKITDLLEKRGENVCIILIDFTNQCIFRSSFCRVGSKILTILYFSNKHQCKIGVLSLIFLRTVEF